MGASPKEVGEREKRGASWALEAWRGSTGLPGVNSVRILFNNINTNDHYSNNSCIGHVSFPCCSLSNELCAKRFISSYC